MKMGPNWAHSRGGKDMMIHGSRNHDKPPYSEQRCGRRRALSWPWRSMGDLYSLTRPIAEKGKGGKRHCQNGQERHQVRNVNNNPWAEKGTRAKGLGRKTEEGAQYNTA